MPIAPLFRCHDLIVMYRNSIIREKASPLLHIILLPLNIPGHHVHSILHLGAHC